MIQTSGTPLKVDKEGKLLIFKLGKEGQEWSLLDSQVYEPRALIPRRRGEIEE